MAKELDFEDIVGLLKSSDELSRGRAVKALMKSNDIRVFPVLQKVAKSDDSVKVRYVAKKALFILKQRLSEFLPSEAGQPARPPTAPMPVHLDKTSLQAIFEGDDDKAKLRALKIIARQKKSELADVLLEAASNEKNDVIRSNIVIVLGMVGDYSYVKHIASFMYDEDPRVRANAIEALELINDPKALNIIVSYLRDPDNRIRANAIKALKHYGRDNVLVLLRDMLHSEEPWMRDSASYALSLVVKDEALDLLLECVNDEHEIIRQRARNGLENLARRGNTRAREALIDLTRRQEQIVYEGEDSWGKLKELLDLPEELDPLKNSDPHVRLNELKNIVQERDCSRLDAVVNVARNDQDAYIQANAVAALGIIGDKKTISVLSTFLGSSNARIRANAIESIGKIGGKSIVSILAPHLRDRNSRCRANAIMALKSFPRSGFMKALESMVRSDEANTRRSAFYAITDIASNDAVMLLKYLYKDSEKDIRKNALHFIQMMAEQGNPAARALKKSFSIPAIRTDQKNHEESFIAGGDENEDSKSAPGDPFGDDGVDWSCLGLPRDEDEQ